MIVTFATPLYEKWLNLLLTSYQKSNPEKKAKIYLIGWNHVPSVSSVRFEFINMPLWFSDKKGEKVESLMRLKMYLILHEIIVNQHGKFVWVDCDSVVLKNLNPIFERLEQCDVLCTMRDAPNHRRFAAGVIGVSSTSDSLHYFAKASMDSMLYYENWYSDQHSLFSALMQKIKLFPLTDDEHSLHGNKNAVIVSHHGNDYEDMKKLAGED